jgi:carbon monoxide dehydrogenase subunit G
MAIQLQERFVVAAPPGVVWDFLVDPRRVVRCVPGGELTDVLDERNFRGKVRIAVGPLTLAYGGGLRLAEVDVVARRVKIVGLARDRAGVDSARLSLESWLAELPAGATQVIALARIDVAGRVVELGRGFLEQLGHVVFQEFAACVAARIESGAGARAPLPCDPLPASAAPLHAIPLVFRALRAWAVGAVRSRRARGSGGSGDGAPAA